MKGLYSRKFVAASALALGGLAAASAAHARSDVQFWVGVQPAQFHVQPAPVYIQPRPVLLQPQPVYVQPQPVYVQPRPVHVRPAPVYVYPDGGHSGPHYGNHGGGWNERGRDVGPDRYGWDDGRYPQHHAWRYGPQRDLDRDGVRNRDDRDRDGDGVRNRRDRFPDDPYRY